jgi:hypothetical protein
MLNTSYDNGRNISAMQNRLLRRLKIYRRLNRMKLRLRPVSAEWAQFSKLINETFDSSHKVMEKESIVPAWLVCNMMPTREDACNKISTLNNGEVI